MDLNSLNKPHFHFVCTNYGSNKDGIGHYTSKIVNELKKNDSFNVAVYSGITHNFSKSKLFVSIRMSLALLKLKKTLKNTKNKNFIILEYPFVEYNPLFLIILISIKLQKKTNHKIVVSLHEYCRTKLFRKLFIKLLIPISDVVLFTKMEDIKPFINKKIIFNKRIIPANIEPTHRKIIEPTELLNICFFGIINFETKEINNMIKGWELYCNKYSNTKLRFHFITSSLNKEIKEKQKINCHFGLEDKQVSTLLHKMQFMILPLKPKISVNNGSLAVSCIHECVPVGIFDEEYFNENFGIRMKNYSVVDFIKIYELISALDFNSRKNKSNLAYKYGKEMSVVQSVKSYSNLVKL